MKKLLKWVGLGVLAAVILAVAGVALVPVIIDPNDQKERIAAEVKAATGRDLVIDGDIGLSLLPSPRVTIEGIRLSNIDGAAAADMVSVKSVDVQLALMPLLSGAVHIENISVVEPRIELEKTADGRANWQLAPTAPAAPETAEEPKAAVGDPMEIRLDRLAIENAALIYRDAATGRVETIGALNAVASSTDVMADPIQLQGDMVARGVPLGFQIDVSDREPGRPLTVVLTLKSTAGETDVRIQTELSEPTPDARVSTTIDVTAKSLAALIAAATGGAGGVPEGAFSFAAEIVRDGDKIDVGKLDLTLGETSASATVAAEIGDRIAADVDVKVGRVDIDKLLATLAPPAAGNDAESVAPATDTPAPADAAETDAAPAEIALPDNIDAKLSVTVDAVVYNGEEIRDAVLKAGLTSGVVALEQVSARLPAGAAFEAGGEVVTEDGVPEFRGTLDFDGGDVRALLAWLDVALPPMADDRLRRLALTADLSARAQAVSIDNLALSLDDSALTGDLTVGLGARPSVALDLNLDQLNVDDYLGQAAAGDGLAAATPDDPSPPAGGDPLAALAALETFDAKANITVGRLTYHEQPIEDVALDVELKDGTLTVNQASVRNLAGARAELSARADKLASNPEFDLTYSVSAPDVAPLVALADPSRVKDEQSLGKLDIKGRAHGSLDAVEFDTSIVLGTASVSVKGTTADMRTAPAYDLTYDVDIADTAPLFQIAAFTPPLPPAEIGRVKLSGGVKGNTESVAVDTSATLAGANASVKGTVGLKESAPVDATAKVSAKDPSRLLKLAGLTPPKKLGGLDITVSAKGDAAAADVAVDVALDEIRLAIEGTVAELGATPRFNLDIDARHPDLVRMIRTVAADYAPQGGTDLGPFSIAMNVAGSAEEIAVSDLAGKIGGTDLDGYVAVALGETTTADVTLRIGTVDVDSLLPKPRPKEQPKKRSAPEGELVPRAPAAKPAAGAAAPPALPDNISANIDISVAAVLYNGDAVRDTVIKGTLDNGILAIERVATKLPAGGSVELSGEMESSGANPAFEGTLAVDAGDLRGLLAWLDVALPGIPEQSLKSLTLNSKVRGQPRRVALDDLTLRLDDSTLSGRIGATMGDRPSVTVALALDQLDLDAYMPGPAEAADEAAGDKVPAPASDTGADPAAGVAALDAFDAEVSFEAARLRYQGQDIEGVTFKANLKDGALTIDDAGVANLAGATANLKASADSLGTAPNFSVTYDITAPEVAPLMALLDPARVAPDRQLGRLDAKGHIEGSIAALKVETSVALPGVSVEVKGGASGLDSAPAFDLAYDIQITDTAPLFEIAAVLPPVPPGDIGAIALTGKLKGDTQAVYVDSTADALGVRAVVKGTVGLRGEAPVDAIVRVSAKDPARLFRLAGMEPPADLGAIDVNLSAKGNAENAALTTDVAVAEGTLRLEGTLAELGTNPRFDVSFAAGHPSVYRLIRTFDSGFAPAGGDNLGGVDVKGRLAGDPTGVTLSDLDGEVATVGFSGGAAVGLGETLAADLKLRVATVDLDRLLPAFAATGDAAAATAADPAPTEPAAAGGFAMPDGIDAKVDIGVESVIYNGKPISKTVLQAALSGGALALNKLSTRLPGGATLNAGGDVVSVDGAPEFQGNLKFDGGDVRALLAWLDVALPGIPDSSLKTLTVASALRAGPKAVAIKDIKVRLDKSTLTGTVEASLGARPMVKLVAALDGIDLDAYVPKAAAPAKPAKSADGELVPTPGGGNPFAALAPLETFDADAAVTVGRVTFNGQPIQDVAFAATLKDGVLNVTKAAVGNLAGATARAEARASKLSTAPAFSASYSLNASEMSGLLALADPARAEAGEKLGKLAVNGSAKGTADAVTFDTTLAMQGANIAVKGSAGGLNAALNYDVAYDVAIADTTVLFKAVAMAPPVPPADIGAVTVKGTVKGDLKSVAVDMSAALAGADASVKGSVGLQGTAPVDIVARLASPDPARLMKLAGMTPPATLGQLNVELGAKGNAENAAIRADVALAEAKLHAEGTVGDLATGPRYDLTFDASHPDTARLIQTFDAGYRPAGGSEVGAFRLSGTLSGSPTLVTLANLTTSIGADTLTGSAEAKLDGKPLVVASLSTERLDLRPLMPQGGAGGGGGGTATDPAPAQSTGPTDKVFPNDPLPLDALRQVDADIKIRAGEILTPNIALQDMTVTVLLQDGHLTVSPLHAFIGGGKMAGNLDFAPTGQNSAALNTSLTIDRLNLGNVLKDIGVTEDLQGELNVNIDLAGAGGSVAALLGSLNGRTDVVMGKGRIDNKYIDLIGADLGGSAMDLLNPFSQKGNYTEINCVVSRFNIVDGLAESEALVFDTSRMSIVGDGTINLKTEGLDIALRPSPKEGAAGGLTGSLGFSLGELAKPFRLSGTLASPSVGVDAAETALALAKATGGVALFGPAGIAAALISTDAGDDNPCLAALSAAEDGVVVPESELQGAEGGVLDSLMDLGLSLPGFGGGEDEAEAASEGGGVIDSVTKGLGGLIPGTDDAPAAETGEAAAAPAEEGGVFESVTKGLGGLIPGLGSDDEAQPEATPEADQQPAVAEQAPAQQPAAVPEQQPAQEQPAEQPAEPSVEETIEKGIGGALKGLFGD